MTHDEKIVEAVARAIYQGRNGKGCVHWGRLPHSHQAPYESDARAAINAVQVKAFKEPSDGLLMSMAIRYDHGLGMPGYYDEPMLGGKPGDHARRLRSTISTMRQLHEEVTGAGFYKPSREEHYRAMMERALPLAPKASP